MKEMLTIGEFAKLRNITTETLRHYDRVDLLKPAKIDEETGYRYYSILQYEKLGTIKELRQLGMSVDEIKKYFNNRNMNQSMDILKSKHIELLDSIKELEILEKNIKGKIDFMDMITKISDFEIIKYKFFEERIIITYNREISNKIDLSYACLELENSLKELAPIVASNRIGLLIKEENYRDEAIGKISTLIIFINDKKGINEEITEIIPKGQFACMYYRGDIWKNKNHLKKMIDEVKERGYIVCGDIIQIEQIDVSVTDKQEEVLFEIQIPVIGG